MARRSTIFSWPKIYKSTIRYLKVIEDNRCIWISKHCDICAFACSTARINLKNHIKPDAPLNLPRKFINQVFQNKMHMKSTIFTHLHHVYCFPTLFWNKTLTAQRRCIFTPDAPRWPQLDWIVEHFTKICIFIEKSKPELLFSRCILQLMLQLEGSVKHFKRYPFFDWKAEIRIVVLEQI